MSNEYLDRLIAEIGWDKLGLGLYRGQKQFDQFPDLLESIERGESEQWAAKWGQGPRHTFTAKYAWAIPDDQAIEAIAAYSPIVEMGAGTGYWAKLLTEAGADVLAYDANPPNGTARNDWHAGATLWFPVKRGWPYRLAHQSNRALFLCWPPLADPMAEECLNFYLGDTIIHIGELGGCTATDKFYDRLQHGWDEVGDGHYVPQWSGIRDYLSIWKRKK